jgi:hypothetical protein
VYFPDLTPYEYGRTEPQANVLNVGWLSSSHPFPRGVPDNGFVPALQRLDNPSSSRWTREKLGWRPVEPALLPDLDRPRYFEN